jgi:pSer/pThr/pTyr-binding forkhead associated (FHA) protein
MVMVRDLGSRNGTWVNGKRISKPKEESKDIPVGMYSYN